MFTNTSVGKGLGNDVVIDLLSDDEDNDDDENDDDNDDEEPTNTAVNSNDGAATTTTTNNNNNNTDPGSDGAKKVNRSKTLYNPYAKNKSLPPSLSTITNENNSHNNISKSKKRKTISSSSLSGVRRGIEPHSLKSRKQRLQEEEQRQQHSRRKLQVGLVLEEDLHLSTDESSNVVQNYIASQRLRLRQHGKQELYHDPDFPPVPSSIHGIHKTSNKNNGDNAWSAPVPPKCRCNKPCRLRYKQPSKSNTAVTTENVASGRRGRNSNHNLGRPFYVCAQTTNNNNSSSSSGRNKCNFFKWAFVAESLHWYRLGAHTHHRLVDASQGYSANDLVQGKIGDCWFLSALAVVAERPDLIQRLFRNNNNNNNNNHNPEDVLTNYGMLSVNLFQDGFWKSVVVDNFLPCMVGDSEEERQLQRALVASRDETNATHTAAATATTTARTITSNSSTASSKYNPFAMSDINRRVLRETRDFLEWDRTKNHGLQSSNLGASDFPMTTPITSHRSVVSNDLAYSKAKGQQLWVPLLEKAYAKCHGSYQAISGGHVAEAFLDLTGAPTLQCSLLQSPGFDPRRFWHQLLKWRRQQLPMGCGTDCHNSEAGIVGMHAYSILDVREISNVDQSFFYHHPTIGNVSGFTNHDDGKVRLLRIRNPHGQGEWKGDFSDQSDDVWERLLLSTTASNNSNGNDIDTQFLHRTMKNDGTFWIDYDHFLMGFSNVDVVLAFLGNHAKSFVSNFPTKTSNHRCQRAFQVTVVPSDTGGMVDDDDTIELYVMGIQKTRRGASHGRIDRKKSYKGCDLGILVGDINGDYEGEGMASGHCPTITNLRGKFFGLTRNGHYRLRLDRTQGNSNPSRSLIIMPISFGHPAATDKDLPFTIRFVANAPLMIREISMVPRMDQVLKQFCTTHYREVDEESHFSFDTQSAASSQEQRMVVLEGANSLYRIVQINCLADGGGTVFLYLYVNEQELRKRRREKGDAISFSVEANCRGMVCRTEQGLLEHETVAKGKKFEAAWRRYSCKFVQETQSRLLMVLVQSGQDTEMGSIVCQPLPAAGGYPKGENALTKFLNISNYANSSYDSRGIFNGVSCSKEDFDISAAAGGSTKLLESRVGIDLELERALAISRGELELQQALEQSRANLPFYRGDTDLQRAIELSRAEAEATTFEGSGSGPHSVRVTSHRTALESDLEKAIKISLEKENKDRKQKISGSESLTFDLRETVDLASQSQKQRPQKEEETIEIIGDEANDQVVSLGCKRQKRELTAEAAMKRWQKKI